MNINVSRAEHTYNTNMTELYLVSLMMMNKECLLGGTLNRSGWTPWELRNSEKDGLDHSDNIWLFLKYIVKSFGIRLV